MDDMRHFNSFCELFQRLDALCKNGGKGSDESKKIIGVMQFHFRFLTSDMHRYLDKFTTRLVEMGYSFNEEPVAIKVDDASLDKEASISKKYEYATLVHDRKQEEVATPGQKAGPIFNYNEFSQPLSKLPAHEFEAIKNKTLENMKFEMACFENHELKMKHLKKYSQPRKWALADTAKDW
jgi:hypothetical protein